MAKEKQKIGEHIESGPPRLPSSSPVYPGSDYSFTLQSILEMQKTLGELTEAVKSLKEQSKSHGEKLENIGKDVHGAKVAMRVIAAIGAALVAVVGWILKSYFHHP